MASWTDKQKRFVEEYCVDFNATQAAIRAGYSEKTAHVSGSRNLSDPDIEEAIEERLNELAMSAAEATKRLGDIARAEIGDFFDIVEQDGNTYLTLDREALLEHGGGLVKEITWDANGRPKLKLYDAQKALKTILDAHGEFNHKQEHEHSGELDVESDTLDDVLSTLTERAERLGEEE